MNLRSAGNLKDLRDAIADADDSEGEPRTPKLNEMKRMKVGMGEQRERRPRPGEGIAVLSGHAPCRAVHFSRHKWTALTP